MHICTFKAQTNTTAQALWQLWTTPRHWPSWDHELQDVEMQGAFKQGSTGTLIYQDGTRRSFTVIKLQMLESLVLSVAYSGNTELLIKRDMRQEGPTLHFEQDVTLSAPFLTKMMMGRHKDPLRQAAGQQMQRTLDLLEGQRTAPRDGAVHGSAQKAH